MAHWRNEAATEDQLRVLRRNNVEITPSLTKGEASDLIGTILMETRNQEDLLIREREREAANQEHFESPATTTLAMIEELGGDESALVSEAHATLYLSLLKRHAAEVAAKAEASKQRCPATNNLLDELRSRGIPFSEPIKKADADLLLKHGPATPEKIQRMTETFYNSGIQIEFELPANLSNADEWDCPREREISEYDEFACELSLGLDELYIAGKISVPDREIERQLAERAWRKKKFPKRLIPLIQEVCPEIILPT